MPLASVVLAAVRMNGIMCMLLAMLSFQICVQESHAGTQMKKWKKYKKTQLYGLPGSSAYFYVTDFMTINADGAPKAYHPDDTGLDALKHAGYPGTSWWKNVLVTDPDDRDKPYIVPSGAHAGYYLSMTALRDRTKAVTDHERYVDAVKVPYLVFPVTFSKLMGVGSLGDLGVAVNIKTGRYSPFVVADIGPKNHPLGEVSIRLAERLGGKNVCPRMGPEKSLGDILYIVFPGSGENYPWPHSKDRIDRIAEDLLASIGGTERVMGWLYHTAGIAAMLRQKPEKT